MGTKCEKKDVKKGQRWDIGRKKVGKLVNFSEPGFSLSFWETMILFQKKSKERSLKPWFNFSCVSIKSGCDLPVLSIVIYVGKYILQICIFVGYGFRFNIFSRFYTIVYIPVNSAIYHFIFSVYKYDY